MSHRFSYDKFPGGRLGVRVGDIIYQPNTGNSFHITELCEDYALAEFGTGVGRDQATEATVKVDFDS
jgi:hypothetical protein